MQQSTQSNGQIKTGIRVQTETIIVSRHPHTCNSGLKAAQLSSVEYARVYSMADRQQGQSILPDATPAAPNDTDQDGMPDSTSTTELVRRQYPTMV